MPLGTTLSVEDQVRIMKVRQNFSGCREDKRFPDVWVKMDGSVLAVRDMSQGHMCMTIGLWLRKEFEAQESESLGLTAKDTSGITKVSPYDTPEEWLSVSESMQTTPSLKNMLARLQTMDGGMKELYDVLQERVTESLENAHAVPEHRLFDQPAFF